MIGVWLGTLLLRHTTTTTTTSPVAVAAFTASTSRISCSFKGWRIAVTTNNRPCCHWNNNFHVNHHPPQHSNTPCTTGRIFTRSLITSALESERFIANNNNSNQQEEHHNIGCGGLTAEAVLVTMETVEPSTVTTTTTTNTTTATIVPTTTTVSNTTTTSKAELPTTWTSSRTYYRRTLPTNTCVALSSPQGRAYFESALKTGHLNTFFPLIEQFTTQSDPAFCGVSTLVMVLNALSVDPRRVWKGPWRWYEESMLNCCIDLEQVKSTGITLPQFICLASCQGLDVQSHYLVVSSSSSQQQHSAPDPNDDDDTSNNKSIQEFRNAVLLACSEGNKHKHQQSSDYAERHNRAGDVNGEATVGAFVANNHHHATLPDDDEHDDIRPPLVILVVSYSRKVVGQTGDGHFSPIGAYDPISDSVLILDTARFKYGAHWVKLPLLWEAMQPIDPATGRARGYVLLSFRGDDSDDDEHSQASNTVVTATTPSSRPPQSLLFRSRMADYQVRRQYLEYITVQSKSNSSSMAKKEQDVGESDSGDDDQLEITWEQVLSYWTQDGSQNRVWDMLHPQLAPIDAAEREFVAEIQSALTEIMKPFVSSRHNNNNNNANGNNVLVDAGCCIVPKPVLPERNCRTNLSRSMCITAEEAIFLVFLASLNTNERRRDIVFGQDHLINDHSQPAREQILSEAELIRLALDNVKELSL